jgi:hypothetical protein
MAKASDKRGLASEDLLEALHCAVAEDLLAKVRSGEATAQELSAAIKFLKDNGIEATRASNPTLGQIEAALPQFDDEDNVIEFKRA